MLSRKTHNFFGFSQSVCPISQDTQFLSILSVCPISQDTQFLWIIPVCPISPDTHTNSSGLSLVPDKSSLAPSWGRSASQQHGPICNCQDPHPGGFIQTYLAKHTGISFRFISQVLSMTSQPPRGRCAAAPHMAPFVTVRTHATSRLSGHCASTDECRVWPLLMNCVSSFNALHSTQFFFARMSDHG